MTLDLAMIFLGVGMTPKTTGNKRKRKKDKQNFIKNKNFCRSKNTIDRVKMQAMEWEKIFTIHISDME